MAQVEESSQRQVPRPLVLTHGTLEIQDVHKSMHFYRHFLGMEVTQHVPFGCRISLGGEWYVVCIEVKHDHSMPLLNHFGLDCTSREEVDAWYHRAGAEKDEYELLEITRPRAQHGAYSFYIKDRDRNWWEVEFYEGDARAKHLEWGQSIHTKTEQRGQKASAQ